ncbi:hypothetical protein [Mycobacterium intracellulare]|uniref:hypothetical protein n=2 Tax=Mycobacterium intracellulare TaxID=1767 RepID=UPI0027E03043|nr:hypothetical protein [Mycobacterium intracellulare]
MRRYGVTAVTVMTIVVSAMVVLEGPVAADPTVDEIAPPLPVIVPTPSSWQPKFPFPYDQTKGSVTPADINAEREMCQWYTAQYETLLTQIDRFDNTLAADNGDYNAGGNQMLADAVTANVQQSVDFLAPRAQSLTQSQDFAGDGYFPLYEGKSFYLMWQLLSNVAAGIRGRQPAWFYGPSVQRVMRWGTRIQRSHVCD